MVYLLFVCFTRYNYLLTWSIVNAKLYKLSLTASCLAGFKKSVVSEHSVGSLSTRVFETRTATGSELFSLLSCLHTTAFALLSIFSPLEMLGIKIWETPLSRHAKFRLPVVVRVSKTCVLKLPSIPQSSAWRSNIRPIVTSISLSFLFHLRFKTVD